MGFQEYSKLSSELRTRLDGTSSAKKILASAAALADAGKDGKKDKKDKDKDGKKGGKDKDKEGKKGKKGAEAALHTSDGGGASTSGPSVLVGSATVPFRPEWDRHALTPRHMAYMRVAEGCDHKCTFCAIPGFRGKFRSKARKTRN